MPALRVPASTARTKAVGAAVSFGLMLLAVPSCASQPVATTPSRPAADATSFTFHAPGALPGPEIDAIGNLVRSRMSGTPGKVTTAEGRIVTATFDAVPSAGMLTSLTAPVDVELRPVLLESHDPKPAGDGSVAATATPDAGGPASPSDVAYYLTPTVLSTFDELDCTRATAPLATGAADRAAVACSQDRSAKYVLGPVELAGEHLSGVTSGRNTLPDGTAGTVWVVSVSLDGQGTTQFAATTARLAGLASPLNEEALLVGGVVVSSPAVQEPIPGGRLVISGSFTEDSAAALAAQIGFQRVPDMTFTLVASR